MRTIKLAVACVAVLVATAGHVQAAVVTYTDRSSFEANTSTNQFIDFESLVGFAQPRPLVIGNASFFNTDDVVGLYRTTGFGAPTVSLAAQNRGGIQIEIAPGATAVGTNIGSIFGPTENFFYDLKDSFGTVASGRFTALKDNSTFLGWTSDMGDLRSLTIIGPGDAFEAIDNFTLGTVSNAAVPEPSSLAIFGIWTYFAGIGAARRRRPEKQQEAKA